MRLAQKIAFDSGDSTSKNDRLRHMSERGSNKTHNDTKRARRNRSKIVDICINTVYNIVMNDIYLDTPFDIIGDKTFRATAERLVIKCGVRADLKGFARLVDAVILYGTETSASFCEIYRMIGEMRKLKPKTVMREISYAVMQAFDIAGRLSELIGLPVPPSDIHSGLVIAYLGKLFQNPDLSVYSDSPPADDVNRESRL